MKRPPRTAPIRLLGASLVAVALAPCATPSQPLEAWRVTRPGVVLLDPAPRRAALLALDPAGRTALCGSREQGWPSHQGITTIRAREGYGGDARPEPFTWTVMNAAAAGVAEDDAAARRALVLNLRRWAVGRSMTRIEGDLAAGLYSIDRALLPVLVAYAPLRGHPDLEPENRALIDGWLAAVMDHRGQAATRLPPDSGVLLNNHRYLADSVEAAYGALTGDNLRFRRGIERYLIALGQMRDDGSFPLEVQRGARALWYQRHAIASLATIAGIAAVQGHDLWSAEASGRSLHRAITYLLDGIEEPRRVWRYASANVSPGPYANYRVQDLGFMVRRGHGRHYMAWADAYLARFPDRPEAARLRALLAEHDPDFRPMIDEYGGGAVSCFLGPLTG
jgi:poly(beta-D-mannuronate) lyase